MFVWTCIIDLFHTDGETNMKLIVAFPNFTNARKKLSDSSCIAQVRVGEIGTGIVSFGLPWGSLYTAEPSLADDLQPLAVRRGRLALLWSIHWKGNIVPHVASLGSKSPKRATTPRETGILWSFEKSVTIFHLSRHNNPQDLNLQEFCLITSDIT